MNRNISVLLPACALALCVASGATAADLKIGVVSVARLTSEAPQAKEAREKLNAEFAPRQKEIQTMAAALKAREDKLTKDAATMTEIQRTAAEKELRDGYRDLQRKQQEAQDDYNQALQEENNRLNGTLGEEVQNFAKAQGYDLILADGVVYATNALDVTGPILTALQSHKAAAPPAAPAAKPAAPATPPATK